MPGRVMHSIRRHRIAVGGFAILALHATAATAWAQRPAKPPDDEGVVLQWVIALGIMIVIGISAFLNPKRSHRA